MLDNLLRFFKGKNEAAELQDQPEEDVREIPARHKPLNPEEFAYDELPPVKEGEINIHSTTLAQGGNGLLVGFFISNGLDKPIKFDNLPLVLTDSAKRVMGRQVFSGDEVGEIPPGTNRACMVNFPEDCILVDSLPEDCSVLFDMPVEPQPMPNRATGLDAQQSQSDPFFEFQALPENLTEAQKQELNRKLAELPPLKEGEINLSPLQLQLTTEQEILTSVIFRNATHQVIKLAQLPLAVLDANHNEIARGLFNIEGLTLQPFKAIIWSFKFPSCTEESLGDVSKWYINLLKQEPSAVVGVTENKEEP